MGAVVVVLTGAFDGLRAVGQGEIPASKTEKRARTMLTGAAFVNPETGLQGA
nr:J267 [uncultured bacterium]